MAEAQRARVTRSEASRKAEETIWEMPESSEFSVVQELLQELQARENDEQRWLATYKKISEQTNEPLIRFLLNLIIADEERHGQLIDRMVSGLKDDLVSTPQEFAGQTKKARKRKGSALLPILAGFVRMEHRGIKDYERLQQVSQGFRHDFFGVICKTMIHDSLKHIAILEFLQVRMRNRKQPVQKRKRRVRHS